MIDRRGFIAGVVAAGSGLALGRAFAAGRFGGLEIGVQSFTFRKLSLELMIEAMRTVGLRSVELWDGHLSPARHTEKDFDDARAKLDAAAIRVSAYCANFDAAVSDELLDKAFRGARRLGTAVMTTSTEKSVVPRLEPFCAKYGVTIGLHNHRLSDSWFTGVRAQNFETPEDWAQALAGRSKRIAINLDIGHFAAAGYDPVAFFREHHRRIVSLHIKDRAADAECSNTRFGRGATPITAVLKLARQLKFKYAVNIEYELDPEDPTPGVRDALEYVEHVLA
jgi:sugar phosphate isomerase/epimerase